MSTLTVDIWSDIACPWCYVGKRRFEAALARFAHRDAVVVTWHSFELDPHAPRVHQDDLSYAARLARKYGTSVQQAAGMIANMTKVGAAEGLDLRFERVRTGNTFDAHRVLQLARQRGPHVQHAVKERLLRAYMTEGEALGNPATLARLAAEAGLDPDAVSRTLSSEDLAEEVRADEHQAAELGIRGVPFFVIDWKYGISGAQPPDVLLGALDQAWADRPLDTPEAAPACAPGDPGGCA